MITWLQDTFGKHYKWAFFFLLIVITTSFVFVLGIGGGHRAVKVPVRKVFGVNVNSEQEMGRFSLLSSVSADLKFGERGLQGGQFQDYLLQRMALLGLAERLSIPGPSAKEMPKFVQGLARFQDDKGTFDPKLYAAYQDQLRVNSRITEADVALVLEQDYRIEKAAEALTGPGFLINWEADRMIASMQTTFALDTAELSYTNFSPDIATDEEAIKKFFEQAGARYQEPEKREVRAIKFTAESRLKDVPAATEEQLKAYFEANKAKFAPPAPPPGADGKAQPAPEAKFEDARAAVLAAVNNEAASKLAGKAADDFTYALFESQAKPGSAELETFLTTRGVKAETLPAFASGQAPAGTNWSAQVTAQAFSLNADRTVSDPLPVGSDYVVLIYANTIPSRQPALDEVRARVTADYKEQERRRLFTEKGSTLRAQLDEKLKAGTAFATAANELGLTHQNFKDVSRQQPPKGLDYAVFNQLDELPTGQISNMVTTAAKGIFVRIDSRKEPDASATSFMAGFVRQNLTQRTAQQTRSAALSEIVKTEFERTAPPEEKAAQAEKEKADEKKS